jgi:Family of unknown function (DUF5335)
MTREIPRSQWEQFFDDFTKTHRAWRATVDSTVPGASAPGESSRVRVVERPLRSVRPETDAERIVRLNIEFQEDPDSRSTIQIARPVSVRVAETPDGTMDKLEIVDEGGSCTRLRFRAAQPTDALDGLAPGELSPE